MAPLYLSMFAIFFNILIVIVIPRYISFVSEYIRSGKVDYLGVMYYKDTTPVRFILIISMQISFMTFCVLLSIFVDFAAFYSI
jgi:hypothetical protein